MSMTVNAFYLFIHLHFFFFQSVTVNSVDFDGFLRLQFPQSLSKLKVLSFLSGTLFVIGHVF